ncbi:hypothetical protein CV632_10225 [Geobacillus thermodenitrificans]|nr:hypothetical protein GD3902_00315 [Geobacillus thermodenitrificans]MED0661854.1 hypothetical protein [Geobacillus thermodenitrificans]PJW20858.1 hypothetical protein CV632_10225 [Geobacillus thermodenitrificans]
MSIDIIETADVSNKYMILPAHIVLRNKKIEDKKPSCSSLFPFYFSNKFRTSHLKQPYIFLEK